MMKVHYTLFVLLIGLAFACNQGAKHPQADLINKNSSEPLTEGNILQLADSIDKNQRHMDTRHSLVYQTKNESTYVEQFSWNGTSQLLVEHIKNEGISSITRKYYFRDSNLMLIKEHRVLMNSGGTTFAEKRTYLRNNIPFKQETRAADAMPELQQKSFMETKEYKESNNTEDFTAKIDSLNQAIDGRDAYELVFDRFISTPDAKYILLKSKIPGDYNATILVEDRDTFTDSLLSNPSLFKEQKLSIKWKIENEEAFYVPVAAKVTSASGLNR